MAFPRVRLVVTADDFGYCPRRDEGIVEAFLAGTVTSVSLLVNGTAAESAAELARRHSIPTGLHANLSEGRPVGPARHNASSLLSPEGFFLGKMGFREALAAGDVALPQVQEELEAQLSRFRELLGKSPTHVDGHQHVHVLPGVCQVFAEALQAYGVRFTRLPAERDVGSCAWLEAPARAFACTVERDARAAIGPFSRHGLRLTSPQATPLISWHSQVDRCLCGPEHLWPAYVCSPSLGITGSSPRRYPCWPRPDCRADGTPRIPQCASSRGLRDCSLECDSTVECSEGFAEFCYAGILASLQMENQCDLGHTGGKGSMDRTAMNIMQEFPDRGGVLASKLHNLSLILGIHVGKEKN
ncbi:carbohydrate deacetylase isoform X2 [Rattus rattus]|uniref:carbohydrate deacetylase isoform X2 n=1 Tax=Rattus rattus TaxID=10117 RepID=UPI0013F34454|nr:carbohydrate deacetylase isoform X2 [Rattus rattus]